MEPSQPEPLRRVIAWDEHDMRPLTELAMACTQCRSEREFHEIVRTRVSVLLPHRGLIAALGQIEVGHVQIGKLVGVEISPECLARVSRQTQIDERPVLAQWLRRLEPLVMELPRDAARMSAAGIREVKDFQLGRMAIHGVMDVTARRGAYFCFTQVQACLPEKSVCDRLRLIVPLLHIALLRLHPHGEEALPKRLPHPLMALSPAEHELLECMSKGMSEDEIASLQRKKRSAIRGQLERLYGKLGVQGAEGALKMRELELAEAAQPEAASHAT